MRIPALALLALALSGAVGYFVVQLSGEEALSPPEPQARALEPSEASEPQAEVETSSLAGGTPAPEVQAAPARVGPRTLDGVVRDRFDQPMGGERVWLLSPEEGHPAEGRPLSGYITGTSSSSGAFSLTLPEEGTYRLGVGALGSPRIPPSSPFETSDLPRAEVTIPGGTAIRVNFDQVPTSEEAIVLEVMTLREPSEGRNDRRGGGGRDRASRGGRDSEGGRGGRRSQQGGRGRGGGGEQGDQVRERRERGGGGGNARQVAFVQDDPPREEAGQQDEPEGLQDQASRRGGGRGQGGERPELQGEIWRAALRHTLTEEELAGAAVELVGVPAGREARLDLRLGRRRIQGLGRFHVAPDIQLDLRVLPLSEDEGAGLGYLISSSPLGPNAPLVGVRWQR